MQWLARLGAEAHHQRAEVIRCSSPRAGPSTWAGCYLTLVVVGLGISMLFGGSQWRRL